MNSTFEKRPSSLRCRSPEATLRLAKEWAQKAGIGAVMEITARDELGLPVYTSPPNAGLHPSYGKGLARIDAEVGAYMEALECVFAAPGSPRPPTRWGTPRDVAGAEGSVRATLELCPLLGQHVDLDGRLLLAEAADIETGAVSWLPAELVFYPAPDVGQALFGASTNGLASGNSVVEASFHALAELVERDVWSLDLFRPRSVLVEAASLPEEIRLVGERAARQGLELVVRSIANDYGVPFFAAFLFAPRTPILELFNGGWGCHLDRTVALTRAVAEAAQSRLAFLVRHGERGGGNGDHAEHLRSQIELVRAPQGAVSYSRVAQVSLHESLEDNLAELVARVRRVTGRPIYRVAYTDEDSELQVVRLIAPMLEYFREEHRRVGPRLKAAIDAEASATAGR
jgi:ribosomal protein S12 methylthiotransferase accessory factor